MTKTSLIMEYVLIKAADKDSSGNIKHSKLLSKSLFGNIAENLNPKKIDYKFKGEIFSIDYKLSKQINLEKESICSLILEASTKRKRQTADLLHSLHDKFLLRAESESFIAHLVYDEASKYYCELATPLLSKFERTLRKILFVKFLKGKGSDWEDELKNSGSDSFSKLKKKGGNIFEEMEYGHYQDLLFKEYGVGIEKQSSVMLFKELKKLNVGSLSKEELLERIDTLLPKSTWNRNFKDYPIDIEDIEKLTASRNKVAHNKFFSRNDYGDLETILKKINKKLDVLSEEAYVSDIGIGIFADLLNTMQTMKDRLKVFPDFRLNIPKIDYESLFQSYDIIKRINDSMPKTDYESLFQSYDIIKRINDSMPKIDYESLFQSYDIIKRINDSMPKIDYPNIVEKKKINESDEENRDSVEEFGKD